jgi:hypothetical protein
MAAKVAKFRQHVSHTLIRLEALEMDTLFWRRTLCSLALCAAAFSASAAEESEQCWKASFAEQLSGPVREQRTSGGPYGYINSYDGDFKWVGQPTALAVTSEYVFCFSERLDSGGVLLTNGKRIELDRIGSTRRPPLVHEGPMSSYTSTRDVREFPALYGIFSTPGKPDTSLEIQLEPLRGVAAVIASSRDEKKRRVVSYMHGTAVRVKP